MTVLYTVTGLALLIALIWATIAVNDYSDSKYDYKPIGIAITAAMVGAWIMVFVALSFLPDGDTFITVWESVRQNLSNIPEIMLDTVVALAVATIIILAVFLRIAIKTNILIAIFSIVVQILFSIPILLLMVILFNKLSD